MFPSNFLKGLLVIPEAEDRNVRHAGIVFHRFMLQDLRECIQKLNAESFADIRSYEDPPALVHNIMKAVLLLLHPEWEGTEKTENWNQCILVRRLFLPFNLPLSDLSFLEVLPASFLQANLSQL